MKQLENFGVEGGPSLTLFYGGGINQQGWCSGENARLPLLWSGINSQTWFHMLVEVVFGSCPCCQSFSPGPPVFFPPQKNQHSKFQFDLETADKKSHFVDCTLLNSHHLLLLLLLLLLL